MAITIIETNLTFKSMTVRSATNRLILHHAAATSCTAEAIHSWHLANGWSGAGYHFLVRKDGNIYRLRPEKYVGAHASGSNSDSIGICFEGNFASETMSSTQAAAGAELVSYLLAKYGISTVQKHSDVGSTACPGANFPFDDIVSGNVTPEINVDVNEYSGSNRYETAAMIVAKEIELASTPFEGVIIANGEDNHFPDSLAASGLAGALGYPILLTAADSLTDSAAEVLTQLKESATDALDVIVIGDTSAISESLRETLASYGEVDSTAQGANRYETASAIYDLGRGKWNTEYTIVTTGENFPDGLSIGPFAAKTGSKVVLINGKSGLTPDVWVEVLESENVVILGDTNTICECVENGLIELFGSDHVERLAGSDRYSTSAKIATWALSHGLSADGVGFATGEKPADALAASFLLGMTGSILLLVSSGSNTEVLKVVSSNAASISEISIFGGTSSVSTSTRNSIYSAL